MKIIITMDIADEYVDETHEMGVTNEGYERLVQALAPLGDDIDVEAAP